MESPALPYNQRALRALELTKEEARALNHNYIDTEDLLLGIFDEGSAATELINHGITAERIRGAIVFITGRPPTLLGDTPRQVTLHAHRQSSLVLNADDEGRRLAHNKFLMESGL